MAVDCRCPSCGANLKVAERHAGRKVKCPKCAGAVEVSQADAPKRLPVAGPIDPPPGQPPLTLADAPPAETAEVILDPDQTGAETAGGGLPKIVVDPQAGSPASRLGNRKTGRLGSRETRAAKESKPRAGKPVWLVAGGISAIVLAAVVVAVLVQGFGMGWLGSSEKANDRRRHRPRWTPSESATVGPYAPATSGGGWLQDMEAAKRTAAQQNKDLLIALEGSDSEDKWKQMWEEIFDQRDFREQVDWRFVLVRIDFPRETEAQTQAAESYRVSKDPLVVLTDARGRPYAVEGYVKGGVETFAERLARWQSAGERLDQYFLNVEMSRGDEKLKAIAEAADLLTQALWRKMELVYFYEPTLDDWRRVAEQSDPNNQKGAYEVAFAVSWIARLARVDGKDLDEFRRVTKELDDWKKKYKFKDPNRAALLHAHAALRLAEAGQNSEGQKHLEAASAYGPQEPFVVFMLHLAKAALHGYGGGGSGTGFVVAADGYILTNNHVIEGAGNSWVRLPDHKEPVPAKVLAKDSERDIALLKIEVPDRVELRPLHVSAAEVPQGAEIGVFGFPLGIEFGSNVTFTWGHLGARRGEGRKSMLVLDCRVNPGNSGGPLCDGRGDVIGMVTLKYSGLGIDSYGMALPAKDLRAFLEKHVPNYKAPAAGQTRLPWEEINRVVSPSVLMITRSE